MLARTAALVATAVVLLVAPAGADAAKVGIYLDSGDIGVVGGYVPVYVAAPGEVNAPTVTVTGTGDLVTFHDPVATLSADPPEGDSPCTLVDAHTAHCVLPDPGWIQREAVALNGALVYALGTGVKYVSIELGDRNDTYVPAPVGLGEQNFALNLDGGSGNDTLTNGPGATGTFGGPGNDFIYAADGVDELVMCGEGTDHVRTLDPGDEAWTDCEDVASP
jgi:Ca2+-binding RTX toxin-like protein